MLLLIRSHPTFPDRRHIRHLNVAKTDLDRIDNYLTVVTKDFDAVLADYKLTIFDAFFIIQGNISSGS